MVFRTLAVLIACTVMLCPPVFAADEWVEDDDMHDFYPQGVQRDQYEVPSHSPYDGGSQPDNDGMIHVGGGMNMRGSSSVGGGMRGGMGGSAMSDDFMNEDGFFSSNQGDVPIAPPRGQMGGPYGRPGGSAQVPPKKKGVLGKIGSAVKAPFDVAGDFFGSPELWYGAGQLAGAGANMYMNRNNPYFNNGGYYNPYNPYYGGMNPYSPYSPYGYGLGGFGGPFNTFGYEPLGMMGAPNGWARWGNSIYPRQAPGRQYYPGLGTFNTGLGGIYNPGIGATYNPALGGSGTPGFGGIYNPGIGGFGLGGALAPMTVPQYGMGW